MEFMRKAIVQSVTAQMDTVEVHAPVSITIIIIIAYYSYRRAERVRNVRKLYIHTSVLFFQEYYSIAPYSLH